MKNLNKILLILSVFTLTVISTSVMAQDNSVGFAKASGQFRGQLESVSQVIGWLAFLSGFVFGVMGIFKFKAYGLNPQDPQNKPMTGVILVLVGAAMIAIPTVMGLGVASLFGAGTTNTSLAEDSSFIQIK